MLEKCTKADSYKKKELVGELKAIKKKSDNLKFPKEDPKKLQKKESEIKELIKQKKAREMSPKRQLKKGLIDQKTT